MAEMVQARRTDEFKQERNDLFNSLLDANDAEVDQTAKLSDSALIGKYLVWHDLPDSHGVCSQATSSSSW